MYPKSLEFYAPDNPRVHQFVDASRGNSWGYEWMSAGWRVQLDYTPNGGGSIMTYHTEEIKL